jgi:hypothetical protein
MLLRLNGISNKNNSSNSVTITLDQKTYANVTNDNISISQVGNQQQNIDLRTAKGSKITDSSILTDNSNTRSPQGGNLTQTSLSYQSTYYQSLPSKEWVYVDVLESNLPNAPQGIKVVPNSIKKNVTIYWLAPEDDQRDIAAYKIYRRENISSPWQLLITVPDIDVGNLRNY